MARLRSVFAFCVLYHVYHVNLIIIPRNAITKYREKTPSYINNSRLLIIIFSSHNKRYKHIKAMIIYQVYISCNYLFKKSKSKVSNRIIYYFIAIFINNIFFSHFLNLNISVFAF